MICAQRLSASTGCYIIALQCYCKGGSIAGSRAQFGDHTYLCGSVSGFIHTPVHAHHIGEKIISTYFINTTTTTPSPGHRHFRKINIDDIYTTYTTHSHIYQERLEPIQTLQIRIIHHTLKTIFTPPSFSPHLTFPAHDQHSMFSNFISRLNNHNNHRSTFQYPNSGAARRGAALQPPWGIPSQP